MVKEWQERMERSPDVGSWPVGVGGMVGEGRGFLTLSSSMSTAMG